ncbi:MAG: hypothetical protein ACPL68_00225 [Candidatus Hydrothermia bacterium]
MDKTFLAQASKLLLVYQPSNGQRAMEPGEVAVDLRANMATEVSAKGSPGSPTTYSYVLS